MSKYVFGNWRVLIILLVMAVHSLGCLDSRADIQLLKESDSWRYEQTANLDGVNWQAPDYDDSSWASGPGVFIRDPNINVIAPVPTLLTIGRTTYYFRTTFVLPCQPSNVASLVFSAHIDDGAAFYLNGMEITRIRMPAAPASLSYNTLATATPDSGDALYSESFEIPATQLSKLVAGTNVLAVELHQTPADSDDIYFGTSVTLKITNSPPIILRPPVDNVVLDGRPATFWATVDGIPAPKFQWLKESVPIIGATSSLLRIPASHPTNAGTYTLVASNAFGVVQMDATLSVQPDNLAPVILSAVAQKSLTNIALSFSEPLLPSSATNTSNYAIFQTANPSNHLQILSASLVQQTNVILVTVPRVLGMHYSMQASGIADLSSATNTITPVQLPLLYIVDLVTTNTQWRYSQDGALPAPNWNAQDYDDSSWLSGAGIFQAGTYYPGTLLSLQTPTNRITTYYFRTEFDSVGDIVPNGLRLHAWINDGAVFYLNGDESYSLGMPTNRPLSYTNTASRYVRPYQYFEPSLSADGWTLPGVMTRPGSNCFAVEVHQHTYGYNDVAFSATLEAIISRYGPTVHLTLPSTVREGNGTFQGDVWVCEPVDADLTLQLTSSAPLLVSAPQWVTIPKGATNAFFSFVLSNDSLVNGPRTVDLTVQASSGLSAKSALTVLDDETNTITVTVSTNRVSETNSGPFPLVIRLASPVCRDITLALSSSDTNSLSIPSTVPFPAGMTSAVVQASVINNLLIDGPRTVTLAASVAGWEPGTATVAIEDNEATTVSIALPASVAEGDATSYGQILLAGYAASNLTVRLTSSAPDILPVASNLTFSAGKSNLTFNLIPRDNTVPEATRTVLITAEIKGFSTASNSISVLDDDPDHFEFGAIDSPQYTDTTFLVTVSAKDIRDNIMTSFNKSVSLTASSLTGNLTLDPAVAAFTRGQWLGYARVTSPGRVVKLGCSSAPGTSNPFQVESNPFRTLNQPVTDIAFDALSGTLFASVSANGGVYSNKLVTIDPVSLTVTNAYPLGYDPQQIELSPDGTFIYAAISNRTALCRFDLASHQVTRVIPLGYIDTLSAQPYAARDIAVLAGSNDSVVVCLGDTSGNYSGVCRFDSGRQTMLPRFGNPYHIEVSPTDQTLYGYQSYNQRPLVRGIANSSATVATTNALFSGLGLFYRHGILYSTDGRAVEANTFRLLGDYPEVLGDRGGIGLPEVDPDLKRTFYLSTYSDGCSTFRYFKAYDRDTFAFLKQVRLPDSLLQPEGISSRQLLRCGTNGFAFATPSRVWLVRSETLEPTTPPADLVLTQSVASLPLLVGSNATLTLSLSNAGPGVATLIQVTNALPSNVSLVSAIPSVGLAKRFNSAVLWNLEQLQPGASATLELTVIPETGGWKSNVASVVASEADANFTNNFSKLSTYVQTPTSDGAYILRYGTRDLVYDPIQDRLILSVTNSESLGQSNGLAIMNPYRGTVETFIPLDQKPGKLAISDDSQCLYVSLPDAAVVRQFQLPGFTLIREFGLGSEIISGTVYPSYAADMAVVPGNHDSLAVWRVRRAEQYAIERGRGVAWVESGILKTNTTDSGGNWKIEFDTDTGLLYAIDTYYQAAIHLLQLNSNGVTTIKTHTNLTAVIGPDIEYAKGRLWSSAGWALSTEPFGVSNVLDGGRASAIEPDAANSRVHLLTQSDSDVTLNTYHMDTGLRIGSLVMTNLPGTVGPMIRWGGNGLAFTVSNSLVLLRSPLVYSASNADLRVSMTGPANLIPLTNGTYTIAVTNCGPQAATSVRLSLSATNGGVITNISYSGTTSSLSSTQANLNLGSLPPNTAVLVSVTVQTPSTNLLVLNALADSDTPDPQAGNNRAMFATAISSAPNNDSVQCIPLTCSDLIWDESSQRIFATIPDQVPAWGNSLVSIEPQSGALQYCGATDGGVGKMKIAGNQLYVAGKCIIQPYSLPEFTIGNPLCFNSLWGNGFITGFDVAPNAPNTLAVATPYCVNIYRDGQPSSDSYPMNLGAGVSYGSSSNQLYVPTSARILSLTVNTNGSPVLRNQSDYLPPWNTDATLLVTNGQIYTGLGLAFDAMSLSPTQILTNTPQYSLLARSATCGRLFYLLQQSNAWSLAAYDIQARQCVGITPISGINGQPGSLIRWGSNGIAFRTDAGQLFIVRTSMVPSGTPADLAVTSLISSNHVGVGADFTCTITVTNQGPGDAKNVSVYHQLPTGVTYVSGTAPGGSPSLLGNYVKASIGVLPAHTSAVVAFTTRSSFQGLIDMTSTAFTDSPDPNLTNNTAQATTQVVLQLQPDSMGQVAIDARDIAYDHSSARLYVADGVRNQIAVLDPTSGAVEAAWQLPGRPGMLRLSKDGTFLYCTVNYSNNVLRLNTRSGAIEFNMAMGAQITDLKPLPWAPKSFLVAKPGFVLAYDETTPRPCVLSNAWISEVPISLEFGPVTNFVHGAGIYSGYYSLSIQSDGVRLEMENHEFAAPRSPLRFDDAQMYAPTGEILDPWTGALLGRFSGVWAASAVEPETSRQRVYLLNHPNSTWRLEAYDPHTTAFLGSISVSNILGSPTTLLRWGDDGFAFTTSSNQLFLLRSSLVPQFFPSGVKLSQSAAADPVLVESNATIYVTMTNSGTITATNLLVLDTIPTNSTYVSATVSQGTFQQTNGLIRWNVGSLSNSASAQMQLTVKPRQAGDIVNIAACPEIADPNNQSTSLTLHAGLNLRPDQYGTIAAWIIDMAYDPSSGLIYAITTNSQSLLSNSIVTIDPATGLIGQPIFTDENLTQLSITDDGSRLLALAKKGKEFLRLNLSTREVELRVPLVSPPNILARASVIKAVPGQPKSAIVIVSSIATVFDDGIPRPLTVEAEELEFYSPDHFMALGSYGNPTSRVSLTPNGLVAEASNSYVVDGAMAAGAGMIYTSRGSVIDPTTMKKIYSYGIRGPVAPAVFPDRIAFLDGEGSSQHTLRIVDARNSAEWGSMLFPNFLYSPEQLLRCGADRLVFRTRGGQLFLLRSSAIPTEPEAQLALQVSSNNILGRVGQPVQLLITVTNSGPNSVSGAGVSFEYPQTMQFSQSAQGRVTVSSNTLSWQIPDLKANEAVSNWVTFVPGKIGFYESKLLLSSVAIDTNVADNTAALSWLISPPATQSAISKLNVHAADLAWDPFSQRLLISVPFKAPGLKNSVISMDPTSAQFDSWFPVGTDPGKLALSDDGQYLYVGLNSPHSISRVTMTNRQVDLTFPINTGYEARDIEVIPGLPSLIAVAREYYPGELLPGDGDSAGVAVYSDGSEAQISIPDIYASESIACSTNSFRLYVNGYNSVDRAYQFVRYVVSPRGATRTSVITNNLITGARRSIEFDNGLIFSSSGLVLEPETLVVITNIPNLSTNALCKPDTASGLLSFLTQTTNSWVIRQYSHTNYSLVREFRVPGVAGRPRSLTHWGTEGLAFITSSNQLFLLRPSLAAADLSVQPASWPTQAVAGQPFQVSFVVSNAGPYTDPDALATFNLPSKQLAISSAQASQGIRQIGGTNVLFQLGALAPGASANLTIALSPSNSTDVTLSCPITISGAFADSDPSNNTATITISAKADSDLDGIPDYWMIQHFGHPTGFQSDQSRPSDDPDHDGMTNLKEYLTGTIPTNAGSAFRILDLARETNGAISIIWSSQPNRRYTIERSSDLLSGFVPVMSNIISTDSTLFTRDLTATNQPQFFYRARLEP